MAQAKQTKSTAAKKAPQQNAQPQVAGTNGFAIAGFVTAILGISLLGLIFGFVALHQLSERKQEGRGLAIAGIIISFVYIGIGVLAMIFVFSIVGFFTRTALELPSEIIKSGNVSVSINETEPTSHTFTDFVLFSQDETAEVHGKNISILEVRDYSPTNAFLKPEAGQRFLAILVQEENTSSDEQNYTFLNYRLKNSDEGIEYGRGFTDLEPDLGSGIVRPEQKARGYIIFEVPTDTETNELELQYVLRTPFQSGDVIWELD